MRAGASAQAGPRFLTLHGHLQAVPSLTARRACRRALRSTARHTSVTNGRPSALLNRFVYPFAVAVRPHTYAVRARGVHRYAASPLNAAHLVWFPRGGMSPAFVVRFRPLEATDLFKGHTDFDGLLLSSTNGEVARRGASKTTPRTPSVSRICHHRRACRSWRRRAGASHRARSWR